MEGKLVKKKRKWKLTYFSRKLKTFLDRNHGQNIYIHFVHLKITRPFFPNHFLSFVIYSSSKSLEKRNKKYFGKTICENVINWFDFLRVVVHIIEGSASWGEKVQHIESHWVVDDSLWKEERKICKNNSFNLFSLLFQLTKAVSNLLCS